jgi:type I protein arginine methyltransferase
MLSDEARVDNYRAAIKALCWEKSVIDVGAGTGILSEMAMDSGALCVYAIEQSQIADEAQAAFQKRRDRKKMMVFRGRAEDFDLGTTKVDLIVSEWMGYFLIFEHMLPSVIAVRDRCLIKGGQIVPSKAELFVAGY